MEIVYIDKIDSTHKMLCEAIRNQKINSNIAIFADTQTKGVGSRGTSWSSDSGNLFMSFSISSKTLPEDLPQSSVSIYFAWQILNFLRNKGSKLWLKWPNDFYLDEKKIGGIIATKINDFIIVSVGINIKNAKKEYGVLDVLMTPKEFMHGFIPTLKTLPSWKHIFSNYKLEFHLSKRFFAHIDGEKTPLLNAKLCQDGSIEIKNKKVFSLR